MKSLRILSFAAIVASLVAPAVAYTPNTPVISGSLTNNHCIKVTNSTTNALGDAGGTCATPLTGAIVYNIAPSGGDFTSVQNALNFIYTQSVAPGTTFTFSLACATTFTSAATINVSSRFGAQFGIVGCNATNHTVTSIVSSSGSAGAYSITLQMGESVSNITPSNDYVVISGCSGGTNPKYLSGAFPVTATNGGVSQITITSPSLASAAPSGSVACSVRDISSVLKFTGSDGLQVWSGGTAVNIQDMCLVGNGSNNALSIQDVGRLFVNDVDCTYNWGNGLFELYNSEVNGQTLGIGASSNNGVNLQNGSIADITICNVGAGSDGVLASTGSSIENEGCGTTGNGGSGYVAKYFSSIYSHGTFSQGNGAYGWNVPNGLAYIEAISTAGGNNTSGDFNLPLLPSNGITMAASANGSGLALGITTTSRSNTDAVVKVLGNNGSHTVFGQGAVAQNAPIVIGSETVPTMSNGEQAMAKISATGSAPGAGYLKFEAVAGTNAGSCKIIAYAGTSTTPVTVVDNVGSGC